jgi:hypothetical protein
MSLESTDLRVARTLGVHIQRQDLELDVLVRLGVYQAQLLSRNRVLICLIIATTM